MGKKRPFKPRGKKGEAHTCLDKGTIKIYWRYKGRTHSMMRAWRPDNPVHVRFVEQLRLRISNDLATGNYDPTLAKYDPRGKADLPDQYIRSLSALWIAFKQASENRVAETTQKRYWAMCDKAIELASQNSLVPESLRDFKELLLQKYALTTTKRILQMLRAAYNWAKDEDLVEAVDDNPFSKLQSSLKEPKSSRSCRAFSQKEVDSILRIFESEAVEYINFVKFLFLTGCRPEEAIALTWNNVKGGFIIFDSAYSAGILKTTKTGESRSLPVNSSLNDVLADQQLVTLKNVVNSNSLVFPRVSTSRYIDLASFTQKIWKPLITKLIESGEVSEYLPTYHCRHTFITNQLKAGKDVATVAQWVGNSSSVIMRHYAAANKEEVPC
jgi:integrase